MDIPTKKYSTGKYYKLLCLAIFTAAVFFSVPLDADFGWYDAGRHAMDGAFYYDLLRDGALLHPISYALKYFQQYPAIAPVFYPPLFALSEALAFSLFGIQAWVARLVVAIFLFWGAWGLSKLGAYLFGEDKGFFAGLLYIATPLVIYWSRDVMLEAPTTALVIWSFYFFIRYFKVGLTKHLALGFLCASLACYTKQNAIFILPVIILTAVGSGIFSRLKDWRFLLGSAAHIISLAPLFYVTFKFLKITLAMVAGKLPLGETIRTNHLSYIVNLPNTLGWPLFILTLLGGVSFLLRKHEKKPLPADSRLILFLMLSWCIIYYLQGYFIKVSEERYGFYWVPVFALFASEGIARLTAKINLSKYTVGLNILLILTIFSWNLGNCKINFSTGLREVALYLKDHWEGKAVVIDSFAEPHLIFQIRALDQQRRLRVYRSSKIFESTVLFANLGANSFINNEGQLFSSMSQYGIRYLLIDEEYPRKLLTAVQKLLRKAVKTDKFEKVKDFPLYLPRDGFRILSLYRFKEKMSPSTTIPTIHLPIVGIEIPGNP